MSKRNCPNCGAPYDVHLNTCPFCSTSYLDMSCLDFESGKPFYLKIKTRMGNKIAYITQKVIPRLGSIEFSTETTDIAGRDGVLIRSMNTGQSLTTNIEFNAIPDGRNLFEIVTEE